MAKIYISIGQSIKSDSGNYYRIKEFLGSGANAYAYRCICTSGIHHGIEFVLKIQYNLSTETRRERFIREAAFLQSCSHPAILRQYDVGTFKTAVERFPFIITNYMPETLADKLKAGGISFDAKVKYSCQLLSAVAFLQSQGIIHRDIKPNNIFISNDNVILGDFGLIKQISKDTVYDDDDVELVNATVMNNFSGYVAMAKYYRTPELVDYANRKDNLHLESDVFQLGLVLAELFTGKNPLKPSSDLHAPIELDEVEYINAPHHGRTIRETIQGMLNMNYRERTTVDFALDRFTGVY